MYTNLQEYTAGSIACPTLAAKPTLTPPAARQRTAIPAAKPTLTSFPVATQNTAIPAAKATLTSPAASQNNASPAAKATLYTCIAKPGPSVGGSRNQTVLGDVHPKNPAPRNIQVKQNNMVSVIFL